MSAADPARLTRIGEVVGAVARQALADRRAARIALLDDGGPEAELAARLLSVELGGDAVVRVRVTDEDLEPLLHFAGGVSAETARRELARMRARLLRDAVAANPASKTALLLGGELPPEPLFPLGDLWASEIESLAGAWSAPEEVTRIAEAAGGIEALDAALRRFVDGRDPAGLSELPEDARAAVQARLEAGRASRLFPRVVPKLGYRTLGVDLFE